MPENDRSKNNDPQHDPTIAKIDELMLYLSRCREKLVEIGDPRPEASEAETRVRALIAVTTSATESGVAVSAAIAAMPEAVARNNLLTPRAVWRNTIERTVDRLHGRRRIPSRATKTFVTV